MFIQINMIKLYSRITQVKQILGFKINNIIITEIKFKRNLRWVARRFLEKGILKYRKTMGVWFQKMKWKETLETIRIINRWKIVRKEIWIKKVTINK